MLACTRLALHKGKDMSEKMYGDRDLMAMDIAGNHYCRHVDHMTRESLHSKSDIAAELGWRDMQIAALQQKLDAVLAEVVAIREQSGAVYSAGYRHGHLNTVDGCAYEPADGEFYHHALQVMLEVEMPVTDALLNAVRAEGAEMVENKLMVMCEIASRRDKETILALSRKAGQIAAKLRAGTDTTPSQYESLAGGK